jgi:hypothetical protein
LKLRRLQAVVECIGQRNGVPAGHCPVNAAGGQTGRTAYPAIK